MIIYELEGANDFQLVSFTNYFLVLFRSGPILCRRLPADW